MKSVCMICGKKVTKDKPYAGEYSCNGAVVGEYIELKGHPTCVENVNHLVVIPNRFRLMQMEQQSNN